MTDKEIKEILILNSSYVDSYGFTRRMNAKDMDNMAKQIADLDQSRIEITPIQKRYIIGCLIGCKHCDLNNRDYVICEQCRGQHDLILAKL